MSAKNLVAWILLAAAVASTTRAGSPVAPPPSLDGPTKDYAAIVQDLSAAQFVVITYYDGTKSMVSNPEWLEPLKKLLAAADGQPDSYCFCRNYPTVTFVGKDRPLATMEVPRWEAGRVPLGHEAFTIQTVIEEPSHLPPVLIDSEIHGVPDDQSVSFLR